MQVSNQRNFILKESFYLKFLLAIVLYARPTTIHNRFKLIS